jgi:hypothetical protein
MGDGIIAAFKAYQDVTIAEFILGFLPPAFDEILVISRRAEQAHQKVVPVI